MLSSLTQHRGTNMLVHILHGIRTYHWVIDGVWVIVGAYFLANTVNAGLSSQLVYTDYPQAGSKAVTSVSAGAQKQAAQNFAGMSARNLMDAQRENLNPKPQSNSETSTTSQSVSGCGTEISEQRLERCSLPMELRGTLVAENPEWSFAVLYDKSEKATTIRGTGEGENEIGNALLCSIETGAVVVQSDGKLQRCEVGEGGGKTLSSSSRRTKVASNTQESSPAESGDDKIEIKSDTEYDVERTFIDDIESNLDKVITQARFVPSFRNGKPQGFKVFSIKPGSPFQKIGLQNGDVLKSVNGYEMSAGKAMELYSKLKTEPSIQVEIMRRGRTFTRTYNIQ